MNTKNNQRFQETERKLEEAFLTLCQDQPPEKISVSMLCRTVDINRSTFYDHYLDIPDLITKTGVRYMKEIGRILNDPEKPGTFPPDGSQPCPAVGIHADPSEILPDLSEPQPGAGPGQRSVRIMGIRPGSLPLPGTGTAERHGR